MQASEKHSMKLVKFIHSMSPYSAGEVAGFAAHVAEKLEAEGFVKIIQHEKVQMTPENEAKVNEMDIETGEEEEEEDRTEDKQMLPQKRGRGRPKKTYITK